MHRFYITPDSWDPDNLRLCEAESHHCLNVLRLGQGDKVTAFNGIGSEAHTEIKAATKSAVRLGQVEPVQSPKTKTHLALGQAIPKGKNMDLIIEKATELGVAEIYPLISERSIFRLNPRESDKKREKWHRVAIEACKQSGQNWLPIVHTPQTPDKMFTSEQHQYDLMLIASLQLGSSHFKEILSEYEATHKTGKPSSLLMMIGPEGDYTPAEINLAQNAGCLPMTLGPIVLRSETAAIYSLSVLAYELL